MEAMKAHADDAEAIMAEAMVFEDIDADKDGFISWDEFWNFMLKFIKKKMIEMIKASM